MNIFAPIVDWYMANINYGTVILLMAVESSFIPFPSEIVIPPAGWKAAEGLLDPAMVALCGVIGSILGAVFNYVFAVLLGRKLIYAFARTRIANALLVNEAGVAKAEAFFNKHGSMATLVGRLVPVIRQLVSLPAGLARMNFAKFLLFTTIGSAIWSTILMLIGYFLFSQKAVLEQFYTIITWIGAGLGVAFVGYLVWQGLKPRPASVPDSTAVGGENAEQPKV